MSVGDNARDKGYHRRTCRSNGKRISVPTATPTPAAGEQPESRCSSQPPPDPWCGPWCRRSAWSRVDSATCLREDRVAIALPIKGQLLIDSPGLKIVLPDIILILGDVREHPLSLNLGSRPALRRINGHPSPEVARFDLDAFGWLPLDDARSQPQEDVDLVGISFISNLSPRGQARAALAG